MEELYTSFSRMKKRRGADKSFIVFEMVKHAGRPFHEKLLDEYNGILRTGIIPENWHVTVFTMLPKSGNLDETSNWRPIVILPILSKIFARLLYQRLDPILE